MLKKITIISVIIIGIPSIAFAAYKPSRFLLPEINGVVCERENICLEDIKRSSEAYELINRANSIVSDSLGILGFEPRYIFCSTQRCYESFGFSKSSGANVGKSAIVVGPRGWREHILAHELIHHWQNHKLGMISVLFGQEWIIEGMAYALSNDPRKTLSEPLQSYRSRYREWENTIDKNNFLEELKSKL